MRRWLLSLCFWAMLPSKLLAGGVVLTFDDWFVDQWHDFFINPATKPPELAGVDVRATFFVAQWKSALKGANQGKADADNHYIKLKQLEQAGHEIGSHSLNHRDAAAAPYSLACNQAAQYVADEVVPSLDAMLSGDPHPSKAGLYQFRPKSYSYPYGSGLGVYDNAIKNTTPLQYLRGTLADRSLPLKDTNAIYHKLGASRPYLIGDGIDFGYDNSVAEIKAALDRASARDEVITLYAHRILSGADLNRGLLGIPRADLLEIILYAQQKGLHFYRFSDAFQPIRVSSACDTVNPPPPPPPPPSSTILTKPTNLRTQALAGKQIKLTWADSNAVKQGFKIERCEGASCINFAEIATVGTVLTYTDSGLQAGKEYRYQIRTFNGTNYSPYSERSKAIARP